MVKIKTPKYFKMYINDLKNKNMTVHSYKVYLRCYDINNFKKYKIFQYVTLLNFCSATFNC